MLRHSRNANANFNINLLKLPLFHHVVSCWRKNYFEMYLNPAFRVKEIKTYPKGNTFK